MSERITLGKQVSLSNQIQTFTAVTVADVKELLNISFAEHDVKIQNLIDSIVNDLEHLTSKTITPEKDVVVAWQSFYDSETLPFNPIKSGTTVTLTDLEGEVIVTSEHKLLNVGGLVILIGDFPNGVIATYTTEGQSIKEGTKEAIKRAVVKCFENESMSPMQAIMSEMKYKTVY